MSDSRAVDSPDFLPCESTTNSLQLPAVVETAIDVAVPVGFVMVAPSAKVVVPDGANHTGHMGARCHVVDR
jgi:hypothetical protein